MFFSKFNLVIKNFVCAIDEILVNFLNCSVLSVFLNFKYIFDCFECSLNILSFDFKPVFYYVTDLYFCTNHFPDHDTYNTYTL